jgi:hypothetical protein
LWIDGSREVGVVGKDSFDVEDAKRELLSNNKKVSQIRCIDKFSLFFFSVFVGLSLGFVAKNYLNFGNDILAVGVGISAVVVKLIISERERNNQIRSNLEKVCETFRVNAGEMVSALSVFEKNNNSGVNRLEVIWNIFDKIGRNLVNCKQDLNELVKLSSKTVLYVSSSEVGHGEKVLRKISEIIERIETESDSLLKTHKEDGWGKIGYTPPEFKVDKLQRHVDNFDMSLDEGIKNLCFYSKAYIEIEQLLINNDYYTKSSREFWLYMVFMFLVSFIVALIFTK